MTIRHVLFDADDVLQQVVGGWRACAEPYFGDRTGEFLREAFDHEAGWMVGGADRVGWLEESLRRYGTKAVPDEVYAAVWLNIAVVPTTLELVQGLRAAGYGVHLGTNQDEQRGRYMRQTLGYDALFDVSCYSYELGIAKPDVGFFVEAVQRIGGAAHEIVFVDDIEANVVSARAAGLAAIRWTVDEGRDALDRRLSRHGVGMSR